MAAVSRPVEERAVAHFLGQAVTGVAVLLVEGEPGIGKTTLWLHCVQQARDRGFRVLSARAGSAEVSMTFAGVADLLGGVDPAVLAELPTTQRLAMDRVLLHSARGPATDEHVVGAALRNVVERIAETAPILLAVDDVQWLDAPSRTALGFAVRRLRGTVGLLGTVRSDLAQPTATQSALTRPDGVAHLQMGPLPPNGLQSLLSARLGRALSRPTLARIAEISGGNPFYALELARGVDDGRSPEELVLPATLAGLVEDRIGRLGLDAADVLLTAAAAAVPTVELIATARNLTVEQVASLLEEPEARGIVVLDGTTIRFTHPLLSMGVYDGASPSRRRAAHRVLAALEDELEVRARHLALAATKGDPSTLAALDAAASATTERGAPSAAAELVGLAIGLGGDTHERRLLHAELLFRSGAVKHARAQLDSLIQVMPPGPLRARALSLMGAVQVYADRFPEAVDVLTRAVEDARDDPALHVLTLLRLAPATGVAGDRSKSIEYARQAVACADALGVDDLRSRALTMWVNVALMYGLGFDEPAMRTALELADPRSDDHLTYQASAVEAVTLSWRGRPDQARERLRTLARHCEERGAEAAAIWVAEHAVMVDVWLGRYPDAARTAAHAEARAEQIGGYHVTVVAAALRAIAAAYTGDVDLARDTAETAIAGAQASGGEHLAILPRTALGFVAASMGDYPAVLAAVAPLLARFDPRYGTEIVIGGFLPDAIEALVAVGRPSDAEPLVAALEANGTRLDRRWMRAVGARGRAMLLANAGDVIEAEHAAQRAMSEHDLLPMPFERARTQILLGQLQRRRRRRQVAMTTLNEALSTFDSLGASRWAHRTQAELQRTRTPTGAGHQLTAAERRVADGAAAGMSNKEIAAALFIAEKTVEMNLSRIYRKLRIRSRAGLSGALAADEARGSS